MKNAVERATVLSQGETIQTEHLPPEVAAAGSPSIPRAPSDPSTPFITVPVGSTIEEAERQLILSTLAHTNGHKTRAAKILGISLKTIHNKVKKFEL